MMSLHLNKQAVHHTLQSKAFVNYAVTSIALLMTIFLQGVIKGDLHLKYFVYALLACGAFSLWAFSDHQYRKMLKRRKQML